MDGRRLCQVDMRAVLNGIFYMIVFYMIVWSGCPWRILPKDYPP
ncbi:MAG: hypothetical protein RMI90_10345 [Thermoguttaceae bacterium]|nr:hypothetical protein [Thermoguttaceae bacterium]